MAYDSGTAATVNDLMTAVLNFLTGAGWTEVYGNTDFPSVMYRTSTDHGGSAMSVGVMFAANSVAAPAGTETGYYAALIPAEGGTTVSQWCNQPGFAVPVTTQTYGMAVGAPFATANISYHFFSDTDGLNVCLVWQRGAGIYNYLGFGFLPDDHKCGSWTGFRYAYGARPIHKVVDTSASNTHAITIPPLPPGWMHSSGYATGLIQVDSDGSGLEWRSLSDPSFASNSERTTRVLGGWQSGNAGDLGTRSNFTSQGGLPNMMHRWARSLSSLAQNVVLNPCMVSAYRDATTRWSPLCRLPLVRAAYTYGTLTDGQQFTVGASTFRAFGSFVVEEIA